ncbi:TonB-dependent siderophore receptor [Ensifer sp.]|jgi:iron complex outermembrane receptor protein|uniref:TonB-dependent siderophore receptor n=1 Tax=Ensifer sp. TaxID=1872086 RepID=UPI002E0E895C|nr:TonB-dependent siderophore receptor [Ensifer sp.]
MQHILSSHGRAAKTRVYTSGNRAVLVALLATASTLTLSEATAQNAASTEGATQLEKITAHGEKGDGPVDGYVAKQSRAGTKTDTPIAKTPQSISVVPREQMEDQAVRSVAEALRYSAGVFTEYRGDSNLHDETFLRGYFYVPRYLNGLAYGTGSLGQIDPYLLERVEVIRGPSSVLYGQANPGGIINLVSKKPTIEPLREVEIGFGTNGQLFTGFDFSGAVPGNEAFSYRLTGAGSKADTQENYLEKERVAIAPSLTWAPDAGTSLTVSAIHQNDPKAGYRNFMEKAGTIDPTPYGHIPKEFLVSDPDYDITKRRQASIGYEFEHELNDTFTFRQNARYTRIDTDYRTLIWNALQADGKTITRMASGGIEDLGQFVIDNQLQAEFDTGAASHTALIGLDYQHANRDYRWGYNFSGVPSIDWTNPEYGNLPPIALNTTSDTDTTARQLGIYAQEQVEIGKLNLLLGGRYDWASTDISNNISSSETAYDDERFTWRTGAIYNFDNGIAPYVSYSTSFEPTLQTSATGALFDPTTAQQFEIGVKYAPEDADYQVIASYYDLTQQNAITYADVPPYDARQTGEIRSRGFELEGHARVTESLSLVAAYSHIDQEVTESSASAEIGKAPARVPKDQASLWVKYDVQHGAAEGLGLGAGVRYIGESQGDAVNSYQVPDVVLFDASLSYDFGAINPDYKGTKLQVNAMNLFDKDYVASCASRWACFYGTGRSVTASLKVSW